MAGYVTRPPTATVSLENTSPRHKDGRTSAEVEHMKPKHIAKFEKLINSAVSRLTF